MGSLIETFHLDVKLIIAQLVNFFIVAGVLYFFALKPIMKIMNERTAKIEKGLTDAQEIEERLNKTQEESKELISQAKKESMEIIDNANTKSEEKKKEIVTNAKKEIESLINQSKKQIADEKEQMIKEVKADVVDLVTQVSTKVLAGKIDADINQKLIEQAIKETNKNEKN